MTEFKFFQLIIIKILIWYNLLQLENITNVRCQIVSLTKIMPQKLSSCLSKRICRNKNRLSLISKYVFTYENKMLWSWSAKRKLFWRSWYQGHLSTIWCCPFVYNQVLKTCIVILHSLLSSPIAYISQKRWESTDHNGLIHMLNRKLKNQAGLVLYRTDLHKIIKSKCY